MPRLRREGRRGHRRPEVGGDESDTIECGSPRLDQFAKAEHAGGGRIAHANDRTKKRQPHRAQHAEREQPGGEHIDFLGEFGPSPTDALFSKLKRQRQGGRETAPRSCRETRRWSLPTTEYRSPPAHRKHHFLAQSAHTVLAHGILARHTAPESVCRCAPYYCARSLRKRWIAASCATA